MIVYPAIDLRRGRCVRLRQGRAEDETVYDDDPAAAAARWVRQGAEWLHVVNLDGAFGETEGDTGLPINLQRLAEIQAAVPGTPIQFGGGIRSLGDVETALRLGARRAILGTVAVQNPELVAEAVERFGAERIVIGIDARDGQVATHGWVRTSDLSASALGRAMRAQGVVRVVYTDIARDGMLSGVNVEATAALARETSLQVIASGGVASLEDLERLKAAGNIEGVIIGQALYAGAVSLADAIYIARVHGGTFSRDAASRGCA
ncbi:MAG: 1-(5-phosphoribosyl)-5-[(5-phosphoribosylamino)methylideneamino]imidazole-4-carboxamide isomerase [Anaerolineae bacterium]|jgi:phosphoribosylformimino-5-aminoimidazole carboxamide ribotide isomerase